MGSDPYCLYVIDTQAIQLSSQNYCFQTLLKYFRNEEESVL